MSENKCNLCLENGKPAHKWIKPEPYSGEVGKLTITHDCRLICRGFTNIVQECSVRNAPFKFTLTQAYVDWVRKHHKSLFNASIKEALNVCPDCRIRELERDINLIGSSEEKEALKELKKITGKGNDNDTHTHKRERERQISQLKSEIAKLEAITNRTAEQEAELNSKKQELAELESQQQEGGFKKYLPWIIGGGIILVLFIGLIVYYLMRKKKKID